jgi:hypothetical protein
VSAIGSFAVLRRESLPRCLALARDIHTETTGRWISRHSRTVGLDVFRVAWQEALVRSESFDHSGYVIGNYLDAQQAVNGVALVDEQSETSRTLAKAFTAGFVFEHPIELPALSGEGLMQFCTEEYGSDAAGMAEAIRAAEAFYRSGIAEISAEHVVVFIVQ